MQWLRTNPPVASRWSALLLCAWLLISSLFLPLNPVFAQAGGVAPGETVETNPKIRTNTVSATVPDNAGPSTPILISPPNGATVTTNTPTFVWQASTDDQGISGYKFFINGVMIFGNLPTTSTTTPQYTLVYNATTQQYSLTQTAGMSDGIYTWKIEAVDNMNNVTGSATWSFTIDTQAPNFILTQVGTASVNISAQDNSTIPTSPIQLTQNEPLLLGTGEPGATVQTTLIIPGEPTQYFTNTISAGGNWGLQLGVLPRGVVMTLNFTITDGAGHVIALNGIQFIIVQGTIVIPTSTPSGSPVPPGVTPPPGFSPPPSPIIEIPITPPREVIIRTAQPVTQRFAPPFRDFLSSLGPFLAVLLAILIPLISTIAVASQFLSQLSPHLLWRILQALGLWPDGRPEGMVFSSQSGKGVPFALLVVTKTNAGTTSGVELAETVLTDHDGIYHGPRLAAGEYTTIVSAERYSFPTRIARPFYLSALDFYKGEPFSLADEQAPNLLIPVDPTLSDDLPTKVKVRLFLAGLCRYNPVLLAMLFIISVLISIVWPSPWNWMIVGIYIVMIAIKTWRALHQPIIIGTVIGSDGQPRENALVRVREPETQTLLSISLSDVWGRFRFVGPAGLYNLSVQKPGYVWLEGMIAINFSKVDARDESQQVVVTLSPGSSAT